MDNGLRHLCLYYCSEFPLCPLKNIQHFPSEPAALHLNYLNSRQKMYCVLSEIATIKLSESLRLLVSLCLKICQQDHFALGYSCGVYNMCRIHRHYYKTNNCHLAIEMFSFLPKVSRNWPLQPSSISSQTNGWMDKR